MALSPGMEKQSHHNPTQVQIEAGCLPRTGFIPHNTLVLKDGLYIMKVTAAAAMHVWLLRHSRSGKILLKMSQSPHQDRTKHQGNLFFLVNKNSIFTLRQLSLRTYFKSTPLLGQVLHLIKCREFVEIERKQHSRMHFWLISGMQCNKAGHLGARLAYLAQPHSTSGPSTESVQDLQGLNDSAKLFASYHQFLI